jgi:hypothetical protein
MYLNADGSFTDATIPDDASIHDVFDVDGTLLARTVSVPGQAAETWAKAVE